MSHIKVDNRLELALDQGETMAVDTRGVEGRRDVEYCTVDELLEDARRLAACRHRTIGNWSYGQILHHLTLSLHGSIDGFGYRMFFPLRFLARVFRKKKILEHGMSPGARILGRMKRLRPHEMQVEDAIEQFEVAVERFKTNPKRAASPVFGRITPEEVNQLELRHAELHMSFVLPLDESEPSES